MKIPITLPSEKTIEVQVIRNKFGTVFVRAMPRTAENPTSAQKDVRDKFKTAAFNSYDQSREEMYDNIKAEFENWIKVEENKISLLKIIKNLYPQDFELISEYLKIR